MGFQAPSSMGDPVAGVGSSVVLRGAREEARQAELSSLPPPRNELVRRRYEPKHMQLDFWGQKGSGNLELRSAKNRGDIQLFLGLDESS